MDMSSFFRLDAITLRGIGPYFHEARLDIRPITVLCGENGSGKSTWLKVLKFLRAACRKDIFPLEIPAELLPIVDGAPTLVNAILMDTCEMSDGSFNKGLLNLIAAMRELHNPEMTHGPLGTIGLEFTALKCCQFGTDEPFLPADSMQGGNQCLIGNGRIPATKKMT